MRTKTSASPFSLEELLRHPAVWRTRGPSALGPALIATGHPALDRYLPGGGWPGGTLTELLSSREGIGELRLLMPALARLSQDGHWIAWVGAPHVPYAPALARHGIDLSRILRVQGATPAENLWAAEQALGSRGCRAVLLWPEPAEKKDRVLVSDRSLRRLQLAAERGGSWGVLFRRPSAGEQPSPAALRLRLEPSSRGLVVTVLKCRGREFGKSLIVDTQ